MSNWDVWAMPFGRRDVWAMGRLVDAVWATGRLGDKKFGRYVGGDYGKTVIYSKIGQKGKNIGHPKSIIKKIKTPLFFFFRFFEL